MEIPKKDIFPNRELYVQRIIWKKSIIKDFVCVNARIVDTTISQRKWLLFDLKNSCRFCERHFTADG